MPLLLDNLAVSEYELIASICEEDYFEFFKEFSSTFIDEEIVYNWHVKYLCRELQHLAEYVIRWEPRPYDLVVNIPPGMTKSSIFSVAFAPWMWTRMPRFRNIVCTHTDLLGKDLSMKARDIIESEKYQKCWPHLSLREDQNTKDKWDNNFGGWRMSVTVGGRTPTGFHAHWITIDDAIDPEKAKSALEIKTATEYCRRTLPTRKVNKRNVPTTMVAQRLDLDDPSGDRLKNEKAGPVKHICLPADDTWDIFPEALKRRYKKAKGLLDPVRLPKSILKQEHGIMGNFGYAGQYGQSPLPKGGIIFNVEELIKRSVTNLPQNIKRQVRYWDKAYTQDGGAYTVGVKMAVTTDDQFYVIDVIRFQKDAIGREREIRAAAERDGLGVKIYVEQEPAAGKESVQNTIRNLRGFRVRADRRGGTNDTNKVMRADPYATQVNAGNVFLLSANWNDAYIEELRYFSEKAKYKDQVDASSGAFNMLTQIKTIGGM